MAAKPALTKTGKTKRADIETKGKKLKGMKRTSIGKSKNSRDKSKDAVRNRKGR